MISDVRTKRVYDPPHEVDGTRVLIDRLWPRGIPKVELEHDLWVPDVAPSHELRGWFGHDPSLFDEFSRRYAAELARSDSVASILEIGGTVTLLTATKDVAVSHAVVLREYLISAAREQT